MANCHQAQWSPNSYDHDPINVRVLNTTVEELLYALCIVCLEILSLDFFVFSFEFVVPLEVYVEDIVFLNVIFVYRERYGIRGLCEEARVMNVMSVCSDSSVHQAPSLEAIREAALECSYSNLIVIE